MPLKTTRGFGITIVPVDIDVDVISKSMRCDEERRFDNTSVNNHFQSPIILSGNIDVRDGNVSVIDESKCAIT